jgi:sugar O-acyltransferase (sialic acid O-acetyltransferase NeuD family)
MFGIFGVNSISLIIHQIVKSQFDDEVFYFDDDDHKLNKDVNGSRVIGNRSDLEQKIKSGLPYKLGISFGEKHLERRKELFHHFSKHKNVIFPVLKHETSMISELAIVEAGNILSFGVAIGHNVHLKPNSVFWSSVVVEHDSSIGESCYLAPNATISGFVNIGDCTLIGSGATILPEIKIGKNCLVGAGSVVTKNVPDNSVVIGVPAKIIRSCN